MQPITTAALLDELTKIKLSGVLGSVASGAGQVLRAGGAGINSAASALEAGGSRIGRLAGAGTRLLPVGGAVYGAHKVNQSDTVQNARARWQMHKAMQAQQQGGY